MEEIKGYLDQALARARLRMSDTSGAYRYEHGIALDVLYVGTIRLDEDAPAAACFGCGEKTRIVVVVRTTQLEDKGKEYVFKPHDLLLCEACGKKYDLHILPLCEMVNKDLEFITGAE